MRKFLIKKIVDIECTNTNCHNINCWSLVFFYVKRIIDDLKIEKKNIKSVFQAICCTHPVENLCLNLDSCNKPWLAKLDHWHIKLLIIISNIN